MMPAAATEVDVHTVTRAIKRSCSQRGLTPQPVLLRHQVPLGLDANASQIIRQDQYKSEARRIEPLPRSLM